MTGLSEISQISIYLKIEAEKVNEVALMQPLMRKAQFNEESLPIAARSWRFTSNLSFLNRIVLKAQSFLFKHFPILVPRERLIPEAKFKTVLAMLLSQEGIRELFLSNAQQQRSFYNALKEAAAACGYTFEPPHPVAGSISLDISRSLTFLEEKKISLMDDLAELNLQIACLNYQERNEILFRILNHIERPPIHSVVEITDQEATRSIALLTQYAKYKIQKYDLQTQTIDYTCMHNQATSSIRTPKNCLPDHEGVINQRTVRDAETQAWIGSYCGSLSTPFHILEQLLFITGQTQGKARLIAQIPNGEPIQEVKVLFTSLYSWNEIAWITDQQVAIGHWDQKILKSDTHCFRLNLLFYNIPFNALNHFPVPAELKATLQDINDVAMITMTADAWQHLGVHSQELKALAIRIDALRQLGEEAFLEKEKRIKDEIDLFRELKPALIAQIETLAPTPFITAVHTLLAEKNTEGKPLKGIDKLLYLDIMAKELGYLHNKNSQNATDRTAGADAADKAQYAFHTLYKTPFMPHHASGLEKSLFKVLYSMYLVWEEPEINTALSTGFLGEKFHNNFIQKNPETTHYLVDWLKKHPETYLGLSDYRT